MDQWSNADRRLRWPFPYKGSLISSPLGIAPHSSGISCQSSGRVALPMPRPQALAGSEHSQRSTQAQRCASTSIKSRCVRRPRQSDLRALLECSTQTWRGPSASRLERRRPFRAGAAAAGAGAGGTGGGGGRGEACVAGCQRAARRCLARGPSTLPLAEVHTTRIWASPLSLHVSNNPLE